MANIYNMTDTWTDGSTLTSIKMNVTDTSSAADSKLLDLQVGGSSKLTVGKDGAITAVQASSVIPFYFANQAAFPSASTYHGAVAHSHADGAMYFAHGGNWLELINADSSGNVGIGTSSPSSKLHVADTFRVARSTQAPGIFFENSSYSGNDASIRMFNSGQLLFYTDDTNRMTIDASGKVSVVSGAVELNSSVVNGIAVTIADDAYATITPTGRYGGNLSVTSGANGAYPQHEESWFGYVDFGASPIAQAINYGTPRVGGTSVDAGSSFDISTSGQPSGTTGTDGKVTLYVGGTSGTFYLENRSGGQREFQITLI